MDQFFVNARKSQLPEIHPALFLMAAPAGKAIP
jgi:hypothetical protein